MMTLRVRACFSIVRWTASTGSAIQNPFFLHLNQGGTTILSIVVPSFTTPPQTRCGFGIPPEITAALGTRAIRKGILIPSWHGKRNELGCVARDAAVIRSVAKRPSALLISLSLLTGLVEEREFFPEQC